MITRPEWGAAPNRGSALLTRCDSLVVHHEAGPSPVTAISEGKARCRSIQAMHQAPPRNWSDTAYSLLCDTSGHVYEGRRRDGAHWWNTQPGATEDENHHTLAICLLGNGSVPGTWTPAAAEAVCAMLDEVRRHWGSHVTLTGHRGWAQPDGTNATECPGNYVWSWLQGDPCADAPPPPTPDPTMSIALLED